MVPYTGEHISKIRACGLFQVKGMDFTFAVRLLQIFKPLELPVTAKLGRPLYYDRTQTREDMVLKHLQ